MNEKELIEKLKDKSYVRAFGLMTPEEQECLRKVGIRKCVIYSVQDEWRTIDIDGISYDTTRTYALVSNYQPEPEYNEKKLIERLKDNKAHIIFADMSRDDQSCIRTAHSKDKVQYLSDIMSWENKALFCELKNTGIYRLEPDYQPEPEYVDLEIVKAFNWLGVWRIGSKLEDVLPHDFTHLHCLPSLPNFQKFWFKDEAGNICRVITDDVSSARDQGKTVYARVRREIAR